jgi:hypothetical protein
MKEIFRKRYSGIPQTKFYDMLKHDYTNCFMICTLSTIKKSRDVNTAFNTIRIK